MKEEPRLVVTRDVDHPVGEWKFHVDQTGVTLKSASAATLQRAVSQHLKVNDISLPDGNFKEWFEDAMCRQQGYPDPYCGSAPTASQTQAATVTWPQLERFAKTMWSLIKTGLKLVPQEEADRRSAICAACPMNQEFGLGCAGCRGLLARAKDALGDRVTAHEGKLKDCIACGCTLKLKVWIPTDVLDKGEAGSTPPDYSATCWRREL